MCNRLEPCLGLRMRTCLQRTPLSQEGDPHPDAGTQGRRGSPGRGAEGLGSPISVSISRAPCVMVGVVSDRLGPSREEPVSKEPVICFCPTSSVRRVDREVLGPGLWRQQGTWHLRDTYVGSAGRDWQERDAC